MTIEIRSYHAEGGELVRKGRTAVEPPPPEETAERFPGDPNPMVSGKTYWGASYSTNDPVASRYETPTGEILSIRRRFYSSLGDINPPNGSLLYAVREDHTAGRLPWVSFKTSWADAKNGLLDDEFDDLIAELESYDKPTWLILNHEPENDGGSAADFRAQQVRFRARLNAWEATNGPLQRIAFGGCLMYYTFNPTSGRDPEDWYPGDGVWDYVGNDHYTEATQTMHRTNPWEYFVTWAESKNLPFTLPEWGLRTEDTSRVSKMQAFWDRMLNGTHDCVGLAYFDDDANSTGSGWLMDTTLLTRFQTIMSDSRVLHLSDLGY